LLIGSSLCVFFGLFVVGRVSLLILPLATDLADLDTELIVVRFTAIV
jgi:hypothetical protein